MKFWCMLPLELIRFAVRERVLEDTSRNVQSFNFCMYGVGCFCGQVSEPHGESFLMLFFTLYFHKIHFKNLYVLR